MKCLYNVTTTKIDQEVRIPFRTRYGGSSRGWLIIVGYDHVVNLIDPISPTKIIKLPPILKNKVDPCFQIRKAILSSDPSTEPRDYEVAAIYGICCRLAFIRPGRGDVEWTYIDEIEAYFDDIIYYKGRLHAVCSSSKTYCFDQNLSLLQELNPDDKYISFSDLTKYLVESLRGDLLLVCRRIEFYENCNAADFEVYKWNPSRPFWFPTKNLDGESLFLGDNMSMSIPASIFPGCFPNSVYFTHDYSSIKSTLRGPICSGIFNLEDSTTSPFYYVANKDTKTLLAMAEQPPIWFVPNN